MRPAEPTREDEPVTEPSSCSASVLVRHGLVTAFAFVGVTVWLSYVVSDRLTRGRVHGSAIAILIGLALAWAWWRRDRRATGGSRTSRSSPAWGSWAGR